MTEWKKVSYLPQSQLRQIQNKKLYNFISTQLYPFSTYYRRLFDKHKIKPRHIKSIEDLKIIPFTTKEDLLPTGDNPESFLDFVLKPDKELIKKFWPPSKLAKIFFLKTVLGNEALKERLNKEYRPIFLTATTGTTNLPISFLYSSFDIENLYKFGYRIVDIFGGEENDRCLNVFPYAPHLAFWQTCFAGLQSHIFMLSTGGGKVMGTDGDINAMVKLRPSVVIGVPSYVYHLVRSAKEKGKNLSFVKKVILGASAVPLGFKEKLVLLLKEMGAGDIHVIGTYGFTEAKRAWVECSTPIDISSGYHTYPDKEIFEVVDPKTGEVKKETEDGELVYTTIDGRGSCVLRYRTGDLVKGGIIYERCPYCQRTVPRISSIISRASDIKNLNLSKIKGTLVNLNEFADVLDAEGEIEEWQVEIRKKNNDPFELDEIAIYLSVKENCDREELKKRLINEINVQTEVTPNEILILSYKQMLERVQMESSRKIKRIVDDRPK